jgi:hypothetical protein
VSVQEYETNTKITNRISADILTKDIPDSTKPSLANPNALIPITVIRTE